MLTHSMPGGYWNALQCAKRRPGFSTSPTRTMTGRLDRVWVECATARDTWGTKRTTKIIHIILLFDPTWGTNCYDMKLSMLVTISREDESKILSYMLHHEESYTDVYWVIHR